MYDETYQKYTRKTDEQLTRNANKLISNQQCGKGNLHNNGEKLAKCRHVIC